MNTTVKNIVNTMTVQEKISLLAGGDFWHTKQVERLGVPAVTMSDGPGGLRKLEEKDGISYTRTAVSYPCEALLAESWDRKLLFEVGEAIAADAHEQGVDIVLGPGANIKRSPLCGRNFEYLSEDPFLSGTLAAAYINGMESKGIGTSLKHFAANNQEHRRLCVNSVVEETALREIYLASFEHALTDSSPTTVMCSYNKLNGEYVCESKAMLQEILREEWGFDGLVVSDWGATNDRVQCLKAGMDIEMPYSGTYNEQLVQKAIDNGTLSTEVLDTVVTRILQTIFRLKERKAQQKKLLNKYDIAAQIRVAEKAVIKGAVLLKNDGLLPLPANTEVCIIGEYAMTPRIGGGGSSHVITDTVADLVGAVFEICNKKPEFSSGYDPLTGETTDELIQHACDKAKAAQAVIMVLGLPATVESEGYDRESLDLPHGMIKLADAVCAVNENVVIVLQNGAPITMPFLAKVSSVLHVSLGGQQVNNATAKLIYGIENPGGKLAESYPQTLQSTPSYLSFPGCGNDSHYTEGVYVGYRYYTAKHVQPLFEFGYGLSYTEFKYSAPFFTVSGEDVKLSFDIQNIGGRDGDEVWQVYAMPKQQPNQPPTVLQLVAYGRISLQVGEKCRIETTVTRRMLSNWCTPEKRFTLQHEKFTLYIGASSADYRLKVEPELIADAPPSQTFTTTSTLGDLLATDKGRLLVEQLKIDHPGAFEMVFCGMEDDGSMFMEKMTHYTVLRSLVWFTQGKISMEDIEKLLQEMNRKD